MPAFLISSKAMSELHRSSEMSLNKTYMLYHLTFSIDTGLKEIQFKKCFSVLETF